MERVFNPHVLATDLNDQEEYMKASLTMAKCTKSCFQSMQENKMLPTEERCMRNCFVKSEQFHSYFSAEMKYYMRNLKATVEE